MHSFIGSASWDGRPARTEPLRAILYRSPLSRGMPAEALSAGGFTVARTWGSGQSLPSARRQPRESPPGAPIVLFNGRLDDRDTLLASLPRDAQDFEAKDSVEALVSAAYRCWGTKAAARLLGDFALVIWDQASRRLYLARDPVGIKPLYYARAAAGICFASHPSLLLDEPGVDASTNEGMVGELLAFGICNTRETLYRGIQRLAPGRWMSMTACATETGISWSPDQVAPVRYRRDASYQEHLLDTLQRAIADRLPPCGRIGVSLSGGLDSTVVTALAHHRLNAQHESHRLRTYSTTYPGEDCDETPYLDAVVERLGIHNERIPWDGFDGFDWREQALRLRDIPEYPLATKNRPRLAAARADLTSVILTGEGSDIWQHGSHYPFRHMLAAGRIDLIAGDLAFQARHFGGWAALRRLVVGLLWPLTPPPLRLAAEQYRGRQTPLGFVASGFARDIDLPERLMCDPSAHRFADASQWETSRLAQNGKVVHVLEMLDRTSCETGMDFRHPLFDRRLIELSLGIPDHLKRRGAENRRLMRVACADYLPRSVRMRFGAARFGVVLRRALTTPSVAATLAAPHILDRPWIDPDAYRAALERAKRSDDGGLPATSRELFALWLTFAIEAWLSGA